MNSLRQCLPVILHASNRPLCPAVYRTLLSSRVGSSRPWSAQLYVCARSQSGYNKYDSWTDIPLTKKKQSKQRDKFVRRQQINMKRLFDDDDTAAKGRVSALPSSEQHVRQSDEETTVKDDNGPRKTRISFLGDAFNVLVDQAVTKAHHMTTGDWDAMDTAIEELKEFHNHWPTKMMKSMLHLSPKSVGAALSLYDYAKHEHQAGVTVAMLAILMSILGRAGSGAHEDRILQLYSELQSRTEVLDGQLTEWVVRGLTQTHRWKECLALLDSLEEFIDCLSSSHLSPVVAAAFRHSSPDVGWQLLEKMGTSDCQLEDNALEEILQQDKVQHEVGLKLLDLMGRFHWIPSARAAQALRQWFHSDSVETWNSQNTIIKNRGLCKRCGHHLQQQQGLSSEDFDTLRDKFMQRAVIKNDVFLNSDPEELSRFQDFLSNCDPYTVVVDGLNIALGMASKGKLANKVSQLRATVDYLVHGLQHSVLVMGRQHMQNWPHMSAIQRKAQCFFTQDSSKDDPYMLYAALHGGPDTLIVTQDELRDHSFLLGADMREMFRRWQRHNQVVPIRIWWNMNGSPVVKFKWPDKYEIRVQSSERGWHIPYEDEQDRPSYELPNTWICIQREQ